MHDRTHICEAVMGRESDGMSLAAPAAPCSLIINSAGIQCISFKNRGSSTRRGSDNLSCTVCALAAQCDDGTQGSEAVWGDGDDMREAKPVQGKHKLCHFIWKQWGTGHWVCSQPHLHCLPSSFTPPPSTEHKRGERGRGGGGREGGGQWGLVGVWLCSFSSVCVRMHRRFSSNLMCVPGDIWWIKAKQLHFAAPPDLPLPVPHIKAGVIADLS